MDGYSSLKCRTDILSPRLFVEKERGNREWQSAMQGLREPKAKRQRTQEAIDIPDDILEEVFLRLPVKSLLRFKSVCKSWRDTIGSRRFKRCQLLISRARRPTMLILPLQDMTHRMRMGEIRFFAYPGHGTTAELLHERLWSAGVSSFTLPMHCDGLVVVPAASLSQIFVCNPATKELVLLPSGSPDYSYTFQKVGFGVDTSTGMYKVVRCFWRYCNDDMTEYDIGCEIFVLGSQAWKPVADPPYLVKSMTPASLPGAIYWGAALNLSTQTILRFNLHDERFIVFPPPPCMELTDTCSNLTNLAGKLCYGYAQIQTQTVQLWMTEDDGVRRPKWLLYFTIVIPCPFFNLIPFSAYEGVIYLCLNLTRIYRYNTESGSLEQVVDLNQQMSYVHPQATLVNPYIPGGLDWLYPTIQYSETLVSISGY